MSTRRRGRKKRKDRNATINFSQQSKSILLDEFTTADLRRWNQISKTLQVYHYQYYFSLQAHRATNYHELCQSLLNCSCLAMKVKDWSRIVGYQYSLEPLSTKGSLRKFGGRFNISHDLDPKQFPSFPCLYIAENYETAFKEVFNLSSAKTNNGLNVFDFALQKSSSFSHVSVNGELNKIFDLTNTKNLKNFVEITKKFKIPSEVVNLAKNLKLKKPTLVSTPKQLKECLLDVNWKQIPSIDGIPSNPQIFGKILSDCGYEGILYPSTKAKGSEKCLAIFIENLAGSPSFIELNGAHPKQVKYPRLDTNTWKNLI